MDGHERASANYIADLLNRVTGNDLVAFIRRAFDTLVPGTRFEESWHIEAIAWRLEQVRKGGIKRLIITMPPRSLKSISASVAFPAFVHGHDPTRQIICVSYSQELAAKHHNDYRALLRAAWYRSVFPKTLISLAKDNEVETALTARGTRLATSIGGTLTGRGGDIVIIDDPLKPADALSQTRRLAVNDWFGSTLASRLNNKKTDAIIIVTQRLHSEDLIGHLTENPEHGWTVLNLPAIAPRDEAIPIGENKFHRVCAGDVLHPAREPRDVLDDLRRSLGSDVFAAQYLQEPVPPGGNMFKREWIQRYEEAPIRGNRDEVIQSWDTASKTGPQNDWSVCTTWIHKEGRYYLLDVFRDKIEYGQLRNKAVGLARRYDPRLVLVEDTNIGTALAHDLKAQGVKTRAIKVTEGKEVRAFVEAAKFEGGLVLLPHRASWLTEFETELFSFPGGRHDDQVDSVVQALAYNLKSGRGGAVSIGGSY